MHATGRNGSAWHGRDETRRGGGAEGAGEGGQSQGKQEAPEEGLREACVAVLNISITH